MKKSNPIVCLYAFAKWSSVKRIAIEVFPTAPSPSRITLYCSCSGSSSESSADRLAVEANERVVESWLISCQWA